MSAVPKLTSRAVAPAKARRSAKDTPEVLSILDRMSINPAISDERVNDRMRFEEKKRDDDVKERSREARRAYDRAMTRMQPALPTIAENGKVTDHDGKVKHTYAEWEDIAEEFRPVLTQHGFNLTFRAAHGSGRVVVKAICAHDDGWREESESTQFYDLTDGKNSNQAVKSAESYGKRAAATLLLNIISRGDDDDGQKSVSAAAQPCISEDQARRIRDTLQTYGRVEGNLIRVLKIKALPELPVSRFDEAMTLIHTLGRMPITRAPEGK